MHAYTFTLKQTDERSRSLAPHKLGQEDNAPAAFEFWTKLSMADRPPATSRAEMFQGQAVSKSLRIICVAKSLRRLGRTNKLRFGRFRPCWSWLCLNTWAVKAVLWIRRTSANFKTKTTSNKISIHWMLVSLPW